MSRRGRIAPVTLLAVLVLGLSACGTSSSTTSNGSSPAPASQGATTSQQDKTSFAKTKFVLHAGLAFGAFHHFIYEPFKAGNLTAGGLRNHKLALVKAGLAGLFAYHEVKLALVDAKSSPLLSRLLSPLTALSAKLKSLGTQLKGGSVDKSAIEGTNTQVGVTNAAAGAAGQSVTETTPTAAQLAAG